MAQNFEKAIILIIAPTPLRGYYSTYFWGPGKRVPRDGFGAGSPSRCRLTEEERSILL